MSTQIIEILVPAPTTEDRVLHEFSIPTGASLEGLLGLQGDSPRLIFRGDPTTPSSTRSFSVVRAGVVLEAAEVAGTYVGSFAGYTRSPGAQDRWHVLAL